MGGRRLSLLELDETERSELQALTARRKTGQALALRARIVLACAQGKENRQVAEELKVSEDTVGKWRRRFVEHRLEGLRDAHRAGAPRTIDDAHIEALIAQTLESVPENATHWSSRGMGQASGLSTSSVQRIWRAFGLQPHRLESFKLSTDPNFVSKVRDVVGLYVAPPERAVVLCVDEKSQIQALDRSQPMLPMRPGQPARRSHDYKRHGVVSLFAALDIATGRVIGKCFHVVFTVPAAVAEIAFQNKAAVYAILFRAAAQTLCTIAADLRHLGAEIGVVAVLHTWGQNLHHHPHVHCVVPGGGLSLDGTRWIACRPGFFLPVRVLSRLFRRLFLEQLQAAFDAGTLGFYGDLASLADQAAFARHLGELRRLEWVVYAKPPFGSPDQVLAYLGRYTHRVAIANSRLVRLEQGQASFRWRDYRHHDKPKVMTLAASEFIRRFLLHTLPDGFHRIRHYGFLANGHRRTKLAQCRQLLAAPPPAPPPPADYRERYRQLTGVSLDTCPCCGGAMLPLGPLPRPARQNTPSWFDSS